MKTRKILISIGLNMIMLFLFSCVQTDDFDLPAIEVNAPDIVANSTIQTIKDIFEQSGENLVTFAAEDNMVVEGFVISSDEAGNFYKVLVIQDKNENATAGVEILIDVKAYFTKYNFGRKIFLKMAGLSVKNDNGKYRIGYNLKNDVVAIPQSLVDNYLVRSAITETILPNKVALSQLSKKELNTFVQLENMQFNYDELGKTYGGEQFDQFNGERILKQCENELPITLSTSTFADFKSNLISNKKGTVEAIFTNDFYGEKYVLVVNNPNSIFFLEDNRCDPQFFYCNDKKEEGDKILYFEDFENVTNTNALSGLGWTNTNTYFGNAKFAKRTVNANAVVRISAFGTEESPLEAWLISPAVNLDNSTGEILSFKNSATFDKGVALTAWVSTNFTGNIKEATWQQLEAEISVGPSGGFNNGFISSGKISLNCLQGNVHIAFRYIGGEPGITTTYDIDNLMITAN